MRLQISDVVGGVVRPERVDHPGFGPDALGEHLFWFLGLIRAENDEVLFFFFLLLLLLFLTSTSASRRA